MSRPFVSVLTPTYNRRLFIPSLIKMYKAQTYPKDRMEWIILDDGTDKVRDLFEDASKIIPNIRYITHDEKQRIGQKRNRLNDEAKGDILVAMDDDDYYPPERVAHVVQKFTQNPTVELAGSSQMFIYYIKTKQIIQTGPYHNQHSTNGTLAYRASYARSHRYNEIQTHSEEQSFLENYVNPMIQLDTFKSILCINHNDNTFDKTELLDTSKKMVKMTTYKLRDFISDKSLREFYGSL